MSEVKRKKKDIKSKIDIIKKINDDPKKVADDVYDAYLKDLPTTDQLFGKKFGDFLEKRKRKKENNQNIFSDVIEIAEGFLTNSSPRGNTDRLFSKNRLKKHGIDSSIVCLRSVKNIVSENVKKVFFSADGICGSDSTFILDNLVIKPQEIDLLNLLTVDPSSDVGQISYEPTQNSGKEKVNRELYNTFTSGPYQFDATNNNTLFTMNWNPGNEEYNVTGLLQSQPIGSVKVEDFFNDYYSSIELPDIQAIVKNAMYLTLTGGNGDNPAFQKGVDYLNRLLSKLFSICGNSAMGESSLKKNPVNTFNENDEDIEFYFNFDDVEGIDIDDENNRFRKVLRFTDCNNFEIPVNPNILEDFVYLTSKKNTTDLVNDVLSDLANNAFNRSDGNIPQINFEINLFNNFILSLPRALIMSIITPKLILPVVIVYKFFKTAVGALTQITDLMKRLWKLFYNIIRDLFWAFIKEFWRLIKIDLLNFVQRLAAKILKNKYRRYLAIVKSLISILQQLLSGQINNCFDLFNIILTTINNSLRGGIANAIPALLLSFSDKLPGYSQDRAYMNIAERIEAAGISLGPIYGEANNLSTIVKSIIDGHTEEEDNNGFIAGGNTFFTMPVPPMGAGPMVFPPGIVSVFGKKR